MLNFRTSFDHIETLKPDDSYNNNFIGSKNNRKYHIKVFCTKERYKCEVLYRNWFSQKGYLCPKLLEKCESTLCIISEYIEGDSQKRISFDQMQAFVTILARIYRDSIDLTFNFNNVKNAYIQRASDILENYSSSLYSYSVQAALKLLTDNFKVGIFKDSKPSNWISTAASEVYLLDFDYVVPSFFLNDLAQLYGYLLGIKTPSSINDILLQFLKPLNLDSEISIYFPLFYIALLISNDYKINYCKSEKVKNMLKANNEIYIYQLNNMLSRY